MDNSLKGLMLAGYITCIVVGLDSLYQEAKN